RERSKKIINQSIVPPSARTATSAPPAAGSAVRSSPAPTAATGPPVVCRLTRGRPHKGKVDLDRLAQQVCVISPVDRGACLFQRRVLDQCVALEMKKRETKKGG